MRTKSKQEVLAGLGVRVAAKVESVVNPMPELPTDHQERDQILARVLQVLGDRRVGYVPLYDIEEDLERSYREDALEDFRENVRAWMKALARRSA